MPDRSVAVVIRAVALAVRCALTGLGAYVLLLILALGSLELPPWAATAWLAAWGGVFVWRYLTPRPGNFYMERLRGAAAWRWLLLTACVLPVFDLAFGWLYLSVFPPPPHDHGALEAYAGRPWGAVPILLKTALVVPIMEEVMLRGWIQGRLEREAGPGVALLVASSLFALLHLQGTMLGYHFVWGLILGYSVQVTRSLWAGVVLHAASNLLAGAARAGLLDSLGEPSLPEGVATGLSLAVVTLSGYVLIRLLRSGPRPVLLQG